MIGTPPHASARTPGCGGFAIFVCVVLMTLLALVAMGMLSLSAIEVRKAALGRDEAVARSNARLALMQAIGQLQRRLGPDQRVSAASSIVANGIERHWTGAWSTRRDDGSSYWVRDPVTGSLSDLRDKEGWNADQAGLGWLVSGEGDPMARLGADQSLELVGSGSVESDGDRVRVPMVGIEGETGTRNRIAWWVGDLGLRANIAVADAHRSGEPNPSRPEEGGYNRVLASQQVDTALMEGGITIANEDRPRLVSAPTLVADKRRADWATRHYHDFTVHSQGVMADVRSGGLKGDLTAYFEGDGVVPALGDLPGLRDDTPIIDSRGPALRHGLTSPRFGALRDWARLSVPFSGRGVATVLPETDEEAGADSREFSLVNELPAKVKGATKTSVQPILVEASHFLKISSFPIGNPSQPLFQLRHHLYPRVVLWNPFNVELTFDPAIVMIQGNGRQEFWTLNEHYDSAGRVVRISNSQWLSFEGGRSTRFSGAGGIMGSEGYNDPYMGSYYFAIPRTQFGPGECLVFSPARAAEYDGQSAYRPGPYNLAANLLSCEVGPDPARSFYVSGSDIGGGIRYRPVRYWYAPTPAWSGDGKGIVNQSDDTRVVMKALTNTTAVTYESFDALPQLSYLSASLQYGAGREPRIAWNDRSKMDVELLDLRHPRAQLEPDVRTREGIRLRWFEEHLSNRINSGRLSNSPRYLEEAPFANWNPRGAYAIRSPWENLGGSLASDASGGGPWFFGVYTRDLYDQSVSWSGQEPVFRRGRYHGNPFGPPQEGRERNILFELPRAETGVVSLGHLQNAKVTEFVWHPSFPIGNSLVDPRLGMEGMDGTVPRGASRAEDALGGFHQSVIGWSRDSQRSRGRDEWAAVGRTLLQGVPEEDNVVYDLSYELNHALWDRYYISSGSGEEKEKFLKDPARYPLPSGRMRIARTTSDELTAERLADFHRAAYHLMVDGSFNVNSTSVEAWKAVLSATRGLEFGGGARKATGTPFPRVLDPVAGAWTANDSADDDRAWAGFRELLDEEIERLASAIVEEVKSRGPFLSLGDFVNRRLTTGATGHRGVLQAAIDRVGLNAAFEEEFPLENDESLRDYQHPDHIRDATRLEQTLKPETKAWGAPGFLTQGDLLQILGPMLAARSDTFVIRAYGNATDRNGTVTAQAWCEAIVQRTPEPVAPDKTGLNPEHPGQEGDFGRRFVMTGFKWLRAEDI